MTTTIPRRPSSGGRVSQYDFSDLKKPATATTLGDVKFFPGANVRTVYSAARTFTRGTDEIIKCRVRTIDGVRGVIAFLAI